MTLLHGHALLVADTFVYGVESDHGLLTFTGERTTEHAVVVLTIVFRISDRRTAVIHQHRCRLERFAIV